MNHAALCDHLRLARTEGIGPVTYRKLLRRFGSAAAAMAALPRTTRAGAPIQVPDAGAVEREIAATARLGGQMLVLDGPGYPKLLALLDDAPPVISVLGSMAAFAPRAVAMVGGRNASANGQRVAEKLAAELAAAGLAVVSGLARGVDTAAHLGALQDGGCTVAAVAGGLDCPYPPENAGLQRRIAESGGAIVTEAPPGTQPQNRHFPRRNRLIAGLALGVVVVEAAPKSGSLITARLAQEAGREIFAVPGSPLDPRARGGNDLIRQGAHLTETAADVLDNLPDHPFREGLARAPLFVREPMPDPLPPPPAPGAADRETAPEEASGARRALMELLTPTPIPVDDLVRRCQFSTSAVMAVLLELELEGRLEALPGHRVALIAP